MPSEFRRITFNEGELLEALVEYDKLADQKFTCGAIVSTKTSEYPVLTVAADVKIYGEKMNLRVELDAIYVGAALVMYCLNNQIPIPMNSLRYLNKIDDGVALCFSMGEAVDGRATILPDYFSYAGSDHEVEAA